MIAARASAWLRPKRTIVASTKTQPVMTPTWNPEIDRRGTRPDWAKRSCRSRSIPPRRPTTKASTNGARVPYREWGAWLIHMRMDHAAVPERPADDTDSTTRVPPGRAAGPGRGIHLPRTSALARAENGRPKGQRAAMD